MDARRAGDDWQGQPFEGAGADVRARFRGIGADLQPGHGGRAFTVSRRRPVGVGGRVLPVEPVDEFVDERVHGVGIAVLGGAWEEGHTTVRADESDHRGPLRGYPAPDARGGAARETGDQQVDHVVQRPGLPVAEPAAAPTCDNDRATQAVRG
ncbi:hypothetical protein [Streptomyces sp. B3I7]|uniref:hypothetical protein n=1 Tax=Streptomyces sp. B3I7 TaxID=3042269 RepID=UPI0027D79768|nr:hypothetical protein [Streptomyces sp. B3I7]